MNEERCTVTRIKREQIDNLPNSLPLLSPPSIPFSSPFFTAVNRTATVAQEGFSSTFLSPTLSKTPPRVNTRAKSIQSNGIRGGRRGCLSCLSLSSLPTSQGTHRFLKRGCVPSGLGSSRSRLLVKVSTATLVVLLPNPLSMTK